MKRDPDTRETEKKEAEERETEKKGNGIMGNRNTTGEREKENWEICLASLSSSRVGHAGISRVISATKEGADANKRLLDVSFPRRFVPWNETSIYGRFVLWTFRCLDVSFSRRFVPWTIRSLDVSFSGRFVLWMFRSFVDNVI